MVVPCCEKTALDLLSQESQWLKFVLALETTYSNQNTCILKIRFQMCVTYYTERLKHHYQGPVVKLEKQ